MSHHISVSPANAMRVSHRNATSDSELLGAYAQIATGIKRPRPLVNRLKDAARGRAIAPLGLFARDSELCAHAGAAWFYVSRPLYVQLARLRHICFGGKSVTIPEALTLARKERAEAECAELNLALTAHRPERSVLAAYIKEEREAIVAEERSVEAAEDLEQRLYAEKK